ncbi:MAG TPA: TonB-dependent receptor plug domain-containing protein [Candidatus Cloacimonadota bacterium]|nr:TonB-dependent receptor plug domain-containing protein [Candidatus Cloacimonadota bacterium]
MKNIISLVMIITAVQLLSGVAINQVKPDTLKTRYYRLEGLRVIGESPSETIGTVHTTSLNTASEAGALNVKDAMSDLPGISMTVGAKDESNLRIRGFRKNDVKVLIDGRPLNSGYFGNVNLQNIPVSDIREIQILKGPASSMYGSNTLGGVVNLVTREPSGRKWFKLGMFVKRNNTDHFELSSSHQFDNWNYWLFASRDHTDGFMLSDDFMPSFSENGGARDNASKTQQHLEGKTSFNFTEFHKMTVTAGITFIPEKFLPSSIYETTYRKYKDWLRMEGTVSSDIQFSPDSNLETMLYLDGGQDTYLEYNDPNFHNMSMDSDMIGYTLGFNPRYSMGVLNDSKMTFGYRGESQFSNRKDNGNYPRWTHHSTLLHNAFAQMEWKTSTPLTITGSTGLSYFIKDSDAMSVEFEPSLGMNYEFPTQTSLSFAIGKNTAFPTMRQLFSVENGNIDLKTQYGIKYELSAKQPFLLKGMNGLFSLSAYKNDIRNLIDLYGDTYANIYQVHTRGGEAELEFNPYAWWNMDYSYSYLYYSASHGYQLTESPSNSCDISWSLHFPYHFTASISSQWKDNRYGQDSSLKYHLLESYWVHSLLLDK